MLAPAILKEAELRASFPGRLIQNDARFFYFQSYVDYDVVIDRNDWKRIQFVSIGNEQKLLAYFEARINRESLIVEDLLVLNFWGTKLALQQTKDLFHFVFYLFSARGIRKIYLRFIKDNPAGRQYERFILRTAKCGSIQGILTDYVILADGKAYDLVIMDILRDPYLEWYRSCAPHPAT